MHETIVLFNIIIEDYPETRDRLAPNSSSVLNPDFENAIVKIQSRRMSELTLNESKAVKCLNQASQTDSNNAESAQSDDLSFAARALKRARLEVNQNDGYKNLKFFLPTSNIYERLFSVTGFALRYNRRSMLPVNLEQKIFLDINAGLCVIADVDAALNK